MPKTLDDLTVDDLFEPCDRCKDAKASGLNRQKATEADLTTTKEFSLSDSASCPLCHGTRRMLNAHGVAVQRLAQQLRDRGFVRPI